MNYYGGPMITLGVPTLKRYDTLVELIASAERGTVVPDKYVVVDNGCGLLASGKLDAYRQKVEIFNAGVNMGVAASWNLLLRTQPEYLIISNDDVRLRENTIELLVRHADLHPEIGFLYGQSSTGDNAWSFFLQRAWLHDKIGVYDENIWPAYFEDNDYCYRMQLANEHPYMVPDCIYDHVGSATLKSYAPHELELHHERFRANREYYTHKWGGEPHHERFTEPFGL